MLKPCKIATRSTATGLFFSVLTTWQMSSMHGWYDALRSRGVRPGGNLYTNNGRLGSQRDLLHGHYSPEEAALYVRAVGVDRIAEALVHSARLHARIEHLLGQPDDDAVQRLRRHDTAETSYYREICRGAVGGNPMTDENESLYGVPPEVVPFANNGHVLADKLLSLGHWVGESYSMWINRPKGTSRAKWQREAALEFVQALPVPEDVYALRHEPFASSPHLYTDQLAAAIGELLPGGTRDAVLLARTIEDVMLDSGGPVAVCGFSLHAQSDTEWLVRIGSGHASSVFRLSAPPPDRVTFTGTPWSFADGSTLVLSLDGGPPQTLVLRAHDFADIRAVPSAELAMVLWSQLAGGNVEHDRTSVTVLSSGGTVQLVGGTARGLVPSHLWLGDLPIGMTVAR